MAFDRDERFVYTGKGPRPWWTTGVPHPATGTVRDMRWPLSVSWGLTQVVVTLDLRTLKLYARFVTIDPLDDADFRSGSLTGPLPDR